MVCKVHKYADGGKVVKDHTAKKLKPHKPAKVKSPILEASKKKGYGPGGPHTPGAKGTYPKKADGGKIAKKGKKPRKPKPEHLGTGMAAKGAQAILDARKRREKEAGL